MRTKARASMHFMKMIQLKDVVVGFLVLLGLSFSFAHRVLLDSTSDQHSLQQDKAVGLKWGDAAGKGIGISSSNTGSGSNGGSDSRIGNGVGSRKSSGDSSGVSDSGGDRDGGNVQAMPRPNGVGGGLGGGIIFSHFPRLPIYYIPVSSLPGAGGGSGGGGGGGGGGGRTGGYNVPGALSAGGGGDGDGGSTGGYNFPWPFSSGGWGGGGGGGFSSGIPLPYTETCPLECITSGWRASRSLAP